MSFVLVLSGAWSDCEKLRKSVSLKSSGTLESDVYLPQCETDGKFSTMQCNSKLGMCWCVDEQGFMTSWAKKQDDVHQCKGKLPALICLTEYKPYILNPT